MDTKIIMWNQKRQEIHIKTSSNDIVTIVHMKGARARINAPAVDGRWLQLTNLQAALTKALAVVVLIERNVMTHYLLTSIRLLIEEM